MVLKIQIMSCAVRDTTYEYLPISFLSEMDIFLLIDRTYLSVYRLSCYLTVTYTRRHPYLFPTNTPSFGPLKLKKPSGTYFRVSFIINETRNSSCKWLSCYLFISKNRLQFHIFFRVTIIVLSGESPFTFVKNVLSYTYVQRLFFRPLLSSLLLFHKYGATT